MENAENRKTQHTVDGELIQFRPSSATRFRYTVTSILRIAIVIGLLLWTYPALEAYFVGGEITGAAKMLESLGFSETWIRRVMIGWCIVLTWWVIGSLFEIIKMLRQKDRFLLRNDGFTVRRTSILSREFEFTSYDPTEFRLRPSDGALEAKQEERSVVLTDGGASEDREWLLDLIKQRYRFSNAGAGVGRVESVATYTVERRPDQSVLIQSSTGSKVGCATLAAVGCLLLIGAAVWLFKDGNGAGVIPLMFCAAIGYAAMLALNHRTVEAAPGKLMVRWSSPAGKLLSRFVSPDNHFFKHQFGEGEFRRESGVLSLKTVRRAKKNEPSFHIVLRHGVPKEFRIPIGELDEQKEERLEEQFENRQLSDEEAIEEDFVLDFTGTVSRPSAEYVLKLLSETTGFEAVRYL